MNILLQSKYSKTFKNSDSASTCHTHRHCLTEPETLQLTFSPTNSPRSFLPIQSICSPSLTNYGDKSISINSPTLLGPSKNIISPQLKPVAEISITSLYHKEKETKDTLSTLPIISKKKISVPELQFRAFPFSDIDQSVIPPISYEEDHKIVQSVRMSIAKDPRKPKIEDYLELLQKKDTDHIKLKFKPKMSLDLKKTSSHTEHSALSANSYLIHSNLLSSSTKSQSKLTTDLAKRQSKMLSEVRDSINDSRLSSKGRQSTNQVKSRGAHSLKGTMIIKKKKSTLHQAENQIMYREIAENIHEIYLSHRNERQLTSLIQFLVENNLEIMKLVLAKYHKINDYDPVKLEQRLEMIEFVSDPVSIPIRLQKKKDGITLLDLSVLYQLQAFSQRLEDYNLKRRNENLELVNRTLKETQMKIKKMNEKKRNQLAKEGKINELFHHLQTYTNGDECLGFQQNTDPTRIVKEIQRNFFDYQHLKKKNIDFALCVNNTYNEWIS